MKQKEKVTPWTALRELTFWALIIFLIRTFGFGLYQVPTGSMETTMLVGERFFADKATYLFRKPQRGEILSFNDPLFAYSSSFFTRLFQNYVWGPSNWTKRVIGIPGDSIKGVIEEGRPVIYLNDKKLDEAYLNRYPLIVTLNDDPEKIYKEASALLKGKKLDISAMEEYIAQYTSPRSYDPSAALDKQPFYLLKENRLLKNENGQLILIQPGTPLVRNQKCDRECHEGKNYWNCTDEFYIQLGENQYWVMGDNREGSQDSRFFGPLDGNLIHGRILFRICSIDSDYHWWIFDLLQNPINFFSRIRWNRSFQFIN